jgi:DNA polymerase III subunit delta
MSAMSLDRMLDSLARGKWVPAIVLLGSDAYLRDLCRRKIIEAYVPESARDWAVARISAREASWDEVIGRAQMLPMLSKTQVIVVEDVSSVEKLGEKSREEIVKALEAYFESPADFTVLLMEATALDGRQRFSKLLHEKALVVELTIGDESAASLAAQMAKDLGVEIDKQAAGLLADILNREPARMRVELEKLATYVGGRKLIKIQDVEMLVVAARRNTVWQFTEMLADRRRDAALEFLNNLLREGEEPVAIVGALAWMYRKLIEARDLPPRTAGFQAARQLGMNPQAAEAVVRQAHRIPRVELLAGLVALAEADSQLKSANPNPSAMMEFLVAQLTSSSAAAASQ